MTRNRRWPNVLMAIGAVLLAGAVLWRFAAVPALVKFPTDTDVTLRYEGTATAFVDPTTAAPLSTPRQEPLTIERHIKALPEASDGANVVIDETITQRAGTLLDTTQHNVYVMDRRSMLNVADGRAYAFDPANVVDRSGSYRVNLPLGSSASETYRIYKNEIATTYELRGDPAVSNRTEGGVSVDSFATSVKEAPLSAAYLSELGRSVPLPRSLTLDQLRPQLLQVGVDVTALLAALTPVISTADLTALTQLAGGTIPLRYVLSFEGRAGIESTTGTQVHVSDTEVIGARPDLAILPQLQEILGHYPNVPQAVSAREGLAALAAAPATKLIEIAYDQTPASIAEVADQVSSNKSRINLVTWYVPGALLAMGLLGIAGGGFLVWRRRDTEVIDLRTTAAPRAAASPAGTAGSAGSAGSAGTADGSEEVSAPVPSRSGRAAPSGRVEH